MSPVSPEMALQVAQAWRDAERAAIVERLRECARICGPDEVARTGRTLERFALVIEAEGSKSLKQQQAVDRIRAACRQSSRGSVM